MDPASLSDEELLARTHGQDQAALGALYDRYSRLVYSVALHILQDQGQAEETTQEVFLNIWRRAGSYQPGRGKVSTWIASVAHHRAIDVVRKRQRDGAALQQIAVEPFDVPSGAEEPDALAERSWERERIRSALGALPEEQRQVLLLAYFRGLTHVEISSALGQPLGTVKTRIRLAVQKLRQQLQVELEGTR